MHNANNANKRPHINRMTSALKWLIIRIPVKPVDFLEGTGRPGELETAIP